MSRKYIFIGDITGDGKITDTDDRFLGAAAYYGLQLSPEEVTAADIEQTGETAPTQRDYSLFNGGVLGGRWLDYNWDDVSGGNNNGN